MMGVKVRAIQTFHRSGIDVGNFRQIANPAKAATLSVVFSFRNEQEVLPELLKRTRSTLQSEVRQGRLSAYELIFVNDASTDRSLEILSAAAGDGDVRILNMSRSFGVTPCVLAGLEHASGDLIVYMDADLQDPPEVVACLLQACRENPGVDVVHTVRRCREGESRMKLWLTALGYRLLRATSFVDLRVEAGDFKLLTRRAAAELVRMGEQNPFLRGMVSWIGFQQTEIHYDRAPRFAGRTKFPVLGIKVLRNFFESALISFSGVPLQIATFLGLAMSVLAFAIFAQVIVEKILGHNIPGWTAIMAGILLIGGLQLLMLGIVGVYLNAIFLQVKQRPHYILKSKSGFADEKPLSSRRPDQQPANAA